MTEFKNLTKTITGNSLDSITLDVQYYSRLGYTILSGHVRSSHKVKCLSPFLVDSTYTVEMQKTIEIEVENEEFSKAYA